MNDTLFVKFKKIENISHLRMIITQKIHGTNAQIYVYKKEDGSLDLLTGCRSRWITPENDNFGFSKYVYENKQSFIELLGEGRHFGEWSGPGINTGEGLKEKRLYLFNTEFIGKSLPAQCSVVQKLYDGPYIENKIKDENLIRNYPKTLSSICKLYTSDLEEENQIPGNEDDKKLIYRNLGKELYPFVKMQIHQILKDCGT